MKTEKGRFEFYVENSVEWEMQIKWMEIREKVGGDYIEAMFVDNKF